jgi:tetratricopeptide (TPR) repeat protein
MSDAVAADDFDQALDLLQKEAGRRPLTTAEMIRMGRWMLLSVGRVGRQPEDALALFERVIAEDEHNSAVLIEIGWYYYAVQNDARRARGYFERAFEAAREDLHDAVEGLANCIRELEGDVAVKRALEDLSRRALDSEAVLQNLLPAVDDGDV